MSKAITKLRVLGQDLAIVADAELVNDRDAYGEYRGLRGEIALFPRATPNRQGDTLIHEAVHVLSDRLDLGLDEGTVRRLAAGVHAVMRDNPKAVRRILAGRRIVGSGGTSGRKNA